MDRESALLSMLKAMWGMVTPNLRGIYIGQKDATKCLYFYYENTPSEDEEELASLMHTEFIADFPLQNIDLKYTPYLLPRKFLKMAGVSIYVMESWVLFNYKPYF